MNKPRPYLYHTIWNGSLNLGDTPGVFNTSAFVGLILQIPVNVTHIPANRLYVELMLYTSDVEIFNSNVHYVYLDWVAGQPFNAPIGQIDDSDTIPNIPEYHRLKIPTQGFEPGNHTITIVVNNNAPVGLKDDFVLYRIDADNDLGIRIGHF